MSYHGKIQTLLKGTADAEIQAWAAEQLEKETNAEPVAWVYSHCLKDSNDDWEGDYQITVTPTKERDNQLPLYTTPQTKPLSDEEIEEIAKKYLSAHAQFIGAGEVCYEGEIDFARAIEERILGK